MHVFNADRGQMGLHLPEKLLIDNFAGGGGASLGMEMAFGRPVDVAINHNEQALGMHYVNHPNTDHHIESVWDVDPVAICKGRPVEAAWFSPDCTHHSKARGGKPRKKEIRGLAWVAIRWMLRVRPEIVPLENVEEFTSWGPLDDEGKPIKEREGETFKAFCSIITTGIDESHPGFIECLEFLELEAGSSDAKRLAAGLGYDIDFKELKAHHYGAPTTRKRFFMIARCDGYPIAWPERTHGPAGSEDVLSGKLLPYRTAAECVDWSIPVKSIFGRKKDLTESTELRIARGLKKFVIDNDDPYLIPAEKVAPFITETAPDQTMVAPIVDRQFGTARGNAIDKPLGTIMANGGGGKNSLVAAFIAKHYGGNYTGSGIPMSSPLHTITTQDHHHLVCAFIAKYYSQGGQWSDIIEPLHTIPTKDRMSLIVVRGEEYVMTDIGQRMFQPTELYMAQGFPKSYIHDHYIDRNGVIRPLTKADQVRMCGNSVSPIVAAALLKANIDIRNKVKARAAA